MKFIAAIAFLIFGVIHVFYVDARLMGSQSVAMSDARQVEVELWHWCQTRIEEGKLTESDVEELFTDQGHLRLGGESQQRTFREMIEHIVDLSAPSTFPGVIAIIIGLVLLIANVGALAARRLLAEQTAAGDSASGTPEQ